MKLHKSLVQRPLIALSALAVVVGAVAPGLISSQPVSAAQVQNRSIMMSDSRPSATSVKYTVAFNVATTGIIQAINVDFCGGNVNDTPLIGDSNCTIPTGMSLTGVAVTSPVTGLSPTTGWSASVINSSHTVTVTNASGASVSSGTFVSFELTGITNPSTNGTFYARILTYDNLHTSDASNYTSAVPGTYVDYGGSALSTAQQVNITAKIMETLTFCVSGSAPGADCTSTTAPDLNIGKTVGSNKILDTAQIYTASAYTQVSTNALHGVNVRMKTVSSSTCAGLSSDNGLNCNHIPAIGATAAALSAGTADFGMCVTPGTNTTAIAPYNDATCAQYGMDETNAVSTYGSSIFSSTIPVNNDAQTLTYAATASNVTPAGIYTTQQSLIATAKF